LPGVQLLDLFDVTFESQRPDVALELDGPGGSIQLLTFGQIESRADRTADVLAARGLSRGDRLCVCLPNSLPFIDIFLACMKLGAVLVPINVLYREREVAHIVGDAAPRAVVTNADAAPLVPEGTTVWNIDELVAAAAGASASHVRAAIDGRTPATLIYTSGTTGRSKGAVLSHDNLLVNAANLIACWRITSADRYLAVLPLFHVHGLANGLVSWLASGCRMRLVERFDVSRAAELFSAFKPTLFFGVPTVYVRLLELPVDVSQAIGRHVRLFVSGSAPLPASTFDAFRARFGHAILERYGMSETLMNIANPYAGERRPGTVGLPLPGVETRIVDGNGTEVGAGEAGELLLRGPNVFQGYWRQPEATAAAFVDGWFRTGDLVERSPDGYYTLCGRRTDLIISGGFKIYPREIEDLLVEHCGVREAAIVGAADPRRGEVPVAYVVADQPIDDAAIEAVCRRSLASFKVPRGFIQVPALPRTAMGKVQKHLLPPWPPPQASLRAPGAD
jgi:malonyl-CoA/methylmalonyl-CoA synthetase